MGTAVSEYVAICQHANVRDRRAGDFHFLYVEVVMSQDSHEHPEQYVPRPYRGYDPDEHGWEQDARDEEKRREDEDERAD